MQRCSICELTLALYKVDAKTGQDSEAAYFCVACGVDLDCGPKLAAFSSVRIRYLKDNLAIAAALPIITARMTTVLKTLDLSTKRVF